MGFTRKHHPPHGIVGDPRNYSLPIKSSHLNKIMAQDQTLLKPAAKELEESVCESVTNEMVLSGGRPSAKRGESSSHVKI